jgi:FlaA1/EpsC-like NDP-sugar epimerase
MSSRLISAVKVALDAVCVCSAVVAAFALQYDGWAANAWPDAKGCALLLTAVTIASLWLLHAYRSLWRYAGILDMARVGIGVVSGSAASYGISRWLGSPRLDPEVAIVAGALAVLLLGAARVGVRLTLSARRRLCSRACSHRVLILGADDDGEAVARELFSNGNGRRPIGFVDDDRGKHGRLIHGLPVLGTVKDLSRIAGQKRIDELVITGQGLSPELCGEVVSACADAGVRMRFLPSLPDLLSKPGGLRAWHEADPQALLGRPILPADEDRIGELIRGRTILVSGAGGSIGSELCRQISRHSPHALYLLDQCENGIFELEQELKDEVAFPVVPVVADVKDRARLDQVFSTVRPSLVVHAAAHKHVPLMEACPEEAVKNNILGTLSIASVAAERGVEKFVLISTDKAVCPSSVMGASKRVAEMIVQEIAGSSTTEFVTVRFGNVLGSSGSVVPVMQRQILRGGSVTVTHPEMTRYFMTIPEAARLVLVAAREAASGDLIVLDMGRPVRIFDLANLLIRLSGHAPGEDVKIRFVGARPGEKLHEEVMTSGESARVHRNGSILTSKTRPSAPAILHKAIARLEALAAAGDRRGIRRELQALVPDYTAGSAPGLPDPNLSDAASTAPADDTTSPWADRKAA